MLERLFFVATLAGAAILIYRVYVQRHVQRATAALSDSVLTADCMGVPVIVYFSTPQCMPCKTQQEPAIRQIEMEMGACVQVIRIDATEQPDAAERWGVFSSPTTFILDTNGQAREVNYGVADASKLRRQLEAARLPLVNHTLGDAEVA